MTEYIKRGIAGDENYMNAYRNAAKAYQCALLWKLTDDRQWANRAIYVLNQYSLITKGIGGNTNQSLVPGFIGYQFLNAAELMRDYDGWAKEDFERFKQWMIDVWFTTAQDFLERRHDTVTREGNWYHYHKIHQEKSLRHQDDKQMAVLSSTPPFACLCKYRKRFTSCFGFVLS